MKTTSRVDTKEGVFRSTWLALARWSAWLVMVLGAVAIAPPAALVPHVPGIVRFALAVLVGLMILPMNRWQRRRDAAPWTAVAAASAAGVIAMFFVYTGALASHTATYAGERVVTGSEPTPLAVEYRRANPAATVDDLLEDAAGNREVLWTRESIVRNEQLLAALYLGLALLLGVTVLATVQVLVCGGAAAPPGEDGGHGEGTGHGADVG